MSIEFQEGGVGRGMGVGDTAGERGEAAGHGGPPASATRQGNCLGGGNKGANIAEVWRAQHHTPIRQHTIA